MWIVVVLCIIASTGHSRSILDFGAIPCLGKSCHHQPTENVTKVNAQALKKAFEWANTSVVDDRTVEIPVGMEFAFFNASMDSLYNVTFLVQGTAWIDKNITAWPPRHGGDIAAFTFRDCNGLRVIGNGTINGQGLSLEMIYHLFFFILTTTPRVHTATGFDWWWWVWLTFGLDDKRPHLLGIFDSENIEVAGIHFIDSPQFHMYLIDVENVHVHDVVVNVTENPATLAARAPVPTFPLNTDGIDIGGRNVLVENCWIKNYDDSVCAKSLKTTKFSSCCENMYVRNITIINGVGCSIGAISPSVKGHCVRNVTFDKIDFHEPFKAVYVKSNPGTEGTGLIEDITYKNLHVRGSLWYPIWVGPEQQRQPGHAGCGCDFSFPMNNTRCITNPLVSINNIRVIDSVFESGITLPGVILCDPKNPCHGISFSNVTNTGLWVVQPNYYCANANVTVNTSTKPVPKCAVVTNTSSFARGHC